MATNNRRHLRIPLERMVEVSFPNFGTALYRSRDLSLGGIFLHAANLPRLSGSCTVTIRECWTKHQTLIRLSGRLVRREASGLALHFTGFSRTTRFWLQTLLLYQSRDPVAMGEDFARVTPLFAKNRKPLPHSPKREATLCRPEKPRTKTGLRHPRRRV